MISISSILTAFQEENVIGTKVMWPYHGDFLLCLGEEIEKFDWNSCRQKGQALIDLPDKVCNWVSAGIGRRTIYPEDYVVYNHRGKVGLYLGRHRAVKPEKVSAVVYTKEAYLSDPDIEEDEAARIKNETSEYVLVAILASAGPKSPLTPNRFIHNLSGGNREALLWSADEIRKKAKEIKEYYNEWCVVADLK